MVSRAYAIPLACLDPDPSTSAQSSSALSIILRFEARRIPELVHAIRYLSKFYTTTSPQMKIPLQLVRGPAQPYSFERTKNSHLEARLVVVATAARNHQSILQGRRCLHRAISALFKMTDDEAEYCRPASWSSPPGRREGLLLVCSATTDRPSPFA